MENKNNKYLMERMVRFAALMKRNAMEMGFNKFFGGVNPHQGKGRILSILKMKPEMSQKELTYLLDIRSQSLSELLAKLEKAGYITREPIENDRRAMNIKLTEEGIKAAESAGNSKGEADKIFDVLNEEEQENLKNYFDKLIVELEKHTEENSHFTPPPPFEDICDFIQGQLDGRHDFHQAFGHDFKKFHEHMQEDFRRRSERAERSGKADERKQMLKDMAEKFTEHVRENIGKIDNLDDIIEFENEHENENKQ